LDECQTSSISSTSTAKILAIKPPENARENKQTPTKKRLFRSFNSENKATQQNKPNSSFTPEPEKVELKLTQALFCILVVSLLKSYAFFSRH
jgi:hypothetical protein